MRPHGRFGAIGIVPPERFDDVAVLVQRRPRAPLIWRALHGSILGILAFEVVYATWQFFVVMAPDGAVGPLGSRARELPFEDMVVRRLYAIEGWIAMGALVIYLAITELRPRLGPPRGRDGDD